MKKMEERLYTHCFMSVHKSYIINMHYIAEINKRRILLDTGADVSIGDSYREKLHDMWPENFSAKK